MSLETWNFRVQHTLESAERIIKYTQGMSFDEFTGETKTVDQFFATWRLWERQLDTCPKNFKINILTCPGMK